MTWSSRNTATRATHLMLAWIFLLGACTPASITTTPATPTLGSSAEELIAIIEVSDPSVPQYDPKSAAYAEFPQAVKQLSSMGNDGISELGYAMSFPRPDAYLAGQALLSYPTDAIETTLPGLISDLHDPRPGLRRNALIVLSVLDGKSSCAVGDIGPLLWDPDPSVRSAAATTLENITGKDLVADADKIAADPFRPNSIPADTPEGKIVSRARAWWTSEGSTVKWHPRYGLCDP